MKITFLGTGGGRYVVIHQLRGSGGFIIEGKNLKLIVDPGPGSLVRAKQYNKDLTKLNSIFVSHRHPDHCTDLEMVIEAITKGAKKKRGILISNSAVVKGSREEPPAVSKYHLNVLEKIYILKPDEEISILDTSLKTTRCVHANSKCMGFVLKDEKKIGYTADGEYYDGQEEYFKNCDCLIINCLRPRNAEPYGHMTADNAKILIEKAKPKLAILQHFGMKMLFGVAEREVKWIEKETGVKTVAARDGKVFEIDGREESLEGF